MLATVFALGLLCNAGAVSPSTPVARKVDIDDVATSMASFEKVEFGLIDQIFALAQSELIAEVKKVKTAAPAGAPGAPGAPSRGPEGGDRIPATGPAFKLPEAYAALKPEMEAAILPKFTPLCATKLEDMVNKMATYLAKHGASNSTIGHSMATHFQVTCEGAMPVKEKQCDDTSVELAKLIESGAPLGPPAGPAGAPGAPGAPAALAQLRAHVPKAAAPAAGPAGAPGGGATESGVGWCTSFFGMYFKALTTPAGAPAR